MDTQRRRGFTLIELLIVIAVVTVLAGLLLSAVQMVRESARRATCTNHVRELAHSNLAHLAAKGHFPGSLNLLGYRAVDLDWQTGALRSAPLAPPRPTPCSWVVPLLPHLGRSDLYERHATSTPGPSTGIPIDTHVELLVCPSDARAAGASKFAPRTQMSYAANCGQKDLDDRTLVDRPPDSPANGVFHNQFAFDHRTGAARRFRVVRISDSFLQRGDGASTTLLLAENVDSGNWGQALQIEASLGLIWWPTVEAVNGQPMAVPPLSADGVPVAVINQAAGTIDQVSIEDTHTRSLFARPASFHSGGVVAAFCDGHVAFLSDDLEYLVYCLLMTPDGSHATAANRNDPAHDLFRRTPLPADAFD